MHKCEFCGWYELSEYLKINVCKNPCVCIEYSEFIPIYCGTQEIIE